MEKVVNSLHGPRCLLIGFFAAFGLLCPHCVRSQEIAVKSNLLSDAITVPSVGAEYAFDRRWTASLDLSWMPLRQSSQHYLRQLKLQPEARYWLHAPFTGPFVGPAVTLRWYNMGGLPVLHTKDSRTQGWLIGVGAVGGYHFTLGDRWGLEPTVALGYAYASYHRYDAPRECRVRKRSYAHYLGPLSLGLQLVYMIK